MHLRRVVWILIATVLAGCSASDQLAPELTVQASRAADGSQLPVTADGQAVGGQAVLVAAQDGDEGGTTVLVTMTATDAGGISNLRADLNDVPVEVEFSRQSRREWTGSVSVAVVAREAEDPQGDLLAVRATDRNLNAAHRNLTLYYAPRIIREIYLGGKHIEKIHNHRAGDASRLLVVLHSDVAGSYELSVRRDLWNGSSFDTGESEPYDAEDVFPDTRGRYRYVVEALESSVDFAETVELVVYLQHVVVTDPPSGEYAHVNDASLTCTWEWGDLDFIAGELPWIVEIRSDNEVRTCSAGTGAVIDIDDTGEYLARVGIQEGDGYAYTADFSSGIVGTNEPPSTPVCSEPPPIVAAPEDYVSFTITATDAEDDSMHYEVQKGSFATLAIFYDPDTRLYTWTDGQFDGNTGAFSWTIPPDLESDDDFELTFLAVDRFGAASNELFVEFDVTAP